ncbi:uncharacterized protein LOC117788516 [Drosophila innubila]|uniref:uncharacterized protein LOC117788516 n=1 Tax=Drosophila innubila TaxID=198719 RepID=UPI00148B6510|nr:uncharacterized protein LOC117788516 [Drosophila innubila]
MALPAPDNNNKVLAKSVRPLGYRPSVPLPTEEIEEPPPVEPGPPKKKKKLSSKKKEKSNNSSQKGYLCPCCKNSNRNQSEENRKLVDRENRANTSRRDEPMIKQVNQMNQLLVQGFQTSISKNEMLEDELGRDHNPADMDGNKLSMSRKKVYGQNNLRKGDHVQATKCDRKNKRHNYPNVNEWIKNGDNHVLDDKKGVKELKIRLLRQETHNSPAVLEEYNVAAFIRRPSSHPAQKSDKKSQLSRDRDMEKLHAINEENFKTVWSDLKRFCQKNCAKYDDMSRKPVVLVPFRPDSEDNGQMVGMCKPDEWKEFKFPRQNSWKRVFQTDFNRRSHVITKMKEENTTIAVSLKIQRDPIRPNLNLFQSQKVFQAVLIPLNHVHPWQMREYLVIVRILMNQKGRLAPNLNRRNHQEHAVHQIVPNLLDQELLEKMSEKYLIGKMLFKSVLNPQSHDRSNLHQRSQRETIVLKTNLR